MTQAPGRGCPIHYRYRPEQLCADPQPADADVLYVIGGLYGNPEALDAIERLAAQERTAGHRVRLVFNGDFNWFNADPQVFARLNERVLRHDVILGNVEYELAHPSPEAGCGCAYPDFVDQVVVERSNHIMARLQSVAARYPDIQARLAAASRWRCYEMAGQTLLILHGDPESLAGWGLAHENLVRPQHGVQVADWFRRTGADVIASTHTCLPAVWQRALDGGLGPRAVINNGAAGMGNLWGDTRGLITRIAPAQRSSPATPLLQVTQGGLTLSLLPVAFSLDDWLQRFLSWWPDGTDANLSYHRRILSGTDLRPDQINL
ncbi:hypothetical protein EZI54_14755 [Marinobacter halodurans]|uniref:Calcineurin-like phosphoesterase domain-containing protein n=1 Tax=Marinobacter halodurans TaxID=2528979 RepID=A0ABY1ZI48_9GAMM|nr:hypothetical protein [Marinobacter halodurans]TBW53753.1 hypothetical protein EZI54_14755 [Marinobacter halodurans]